MTDYPMDMLSAYRRVTTATLTTTLLKKGLRNVWVRGAFPLAPNPGRVAGPAFTLRFVPAREDLATPDSLSSPRSTRAAIEAMPQGCIAVVAADGCPDAGVFGDILCQRMAVRNVAAMVTDGVVRDLGGIRDTGFGVWAAGTAAPPSVAALTFVGWQDPIGCGGVAIFPDDLIVADEDGAVVIPSRLADAVLDEAQEQEALEAWIVDEVRRGAALPGLYPPDDEALHRYRQQVRRSRTLP